MLIAWQVEVRNDNDELVHRRYRIEGEVQP